jgi:xylulokinase
LRLTDEVLSEPSDASATLLYDFETDGWSSAVIRALGLREEVFPPLIASGTPAGMLVRSAAEVLGLPAGLPVAAGAGDTAAALLGSGLLEPGPVQFMVGTAGQILSPRESPVPDPHFRTHLYRAAHDHHPGRHYAMAAIQNAGLALEWVLKMLKVSWEEAYREVFSVSPGAGGITFLPYLSGERTPHLDPDIRGAWTGLGLVHGRAQLLRAAFEGVAFALREGLEALEDIGISVPELRLAGGGVLEAPWQQLLADVLGRPLKLLPPSVVSSASARGAALLAGIACGVYASVEEILLLRPEIRETVLPREGASYEAAYTRYKELYLRLRRW